jgi:hypothetical protein
MIDPIDSSGILNLGRIAGNLGALEKSLALSPIR